MGSSPIHSTPCHYERGATMTINLQTMVIQLASSFFHELGMEPGIDFNEGSIEVNKPEDMSEEEFGVVISDMAEHIRVNTEKYISG